MYATSLLLQSIFGLFVVYEDTHVHTSECICIFRVVQFLFLGNVVFYLPSSVTGKVMSLNRTPLQRALIEVRPRPL